MKIGIDARLIHWPGIGRYIEQMICWLPRVAPSHQFVLFCQRDQVPKLEPFVADLASNIIEPSAPPIFSVREQFEWPSLIRRHRLDHFFSPHLVVPLLSRVPVTLTIHDLVTLTLPEAATSTIARLYFFLMIRLASWRASNIVTVSNFTKSEVHRHLNVSNDRIRVIHSGTTFNSPQPLGLANGEADPYILYVGTRKPWKNLNVLLTAFQLHTQHCPETKLVIVGKRAANNEVDVDEIIRSLNLDSKVTCMGPVDDFQLQMLYRGCTVLVCPSYYEGFGFSALEGMSLGCPVVATKIPPYQEVLGDCALFCDPRDPEQMAHWITELVTHPELRNDLSRRAELRAKSFSWEKAARLTIGLFSDGVGAGSL